MGLCPSNARNAKSDHGWEEDSVGQEGSCSGQTWREMKGRRKEGRERREGQGQQEEDMVSIQQTIFV